MSPIIIYTVVACFLAGLLAQACVGIGFGVNLDLIMIGDIMLFIPGPVSYTHLDVYKRQGPHFKGTADQKQDHKPRRAQGNGKEGQGIGVVFHGIQTVSYTHLDITSENNGVTATLRSVVGRCV